MRTLEAMRPEKRRRIARETMEIYAPIANRLGLNNIYHELQDLSFRYLFPTRYRVLGNATKAARGNRREMVTKILDTIKQRLKAAGLDAEVTGREKQLYSIYKKMAEKHLTFSEVLDIYGFRVIVKDVPSCYIALGALHSLYNPIPGKFKDYIAIPKANGYQSLHNTLWGPYGTPIEVQIRTPEMHRIAEAGVASHWLYKSTDADLNDLHMKTHQWLQSLLETLSDSTDSLEFLEHLKVDLFPGEVYVFTPQGKILALPKGSTAVDFAYAVHTDIGDCCVAAKINGENAPLRTVLRSGDRVEIVTASHAKPNPAWLNYVVTGKARSHIRRFLKTMQYEESARLGERLLNQALMFAQGRSPNDNRGAMGKTGARQRSQIEERFTGGHGLGQAPAGGNRAGGWPRRESPSDGTSGPADVITILGTEGMAVQFAKCCRPIPEDPVVGFIKKDQGLIIHTHDCPAVSKNRGNSDNWLDVGWGKEINRQFEVSIKLMVTNQRGVLARVAAAIAEAGSNIDNVGMEGDGAYTTMTFMLQVRNRHHLAQVMRSLRHTRK